VFADHAKYELFGPLGLLLPTEVLRKHSCAESLEEFRAERLD